MIRVDMGEPEVTSQLPEKITVSGKDLEFVGISVGNPHAVYFMDEIDSLDLEKIGPAFETHTRFPDRVNTEFVRIIDREHIQMRVWEQGKRRNLGLRYRRYGQCSGFCSDGIYRTKSRCGAKGRTPSD